jgi:predicted permease
VGARREFREPLALLMTAVGIVLLIASANLAGLQLARGAARRREFTVRAALGAGRRRIVRQLLTESVLLALMGGAGGLLFARWGTAFLANFLAQSDAPVALTPDSRALSFTIVTSLMTAAVFGLAPAWRFSRPDLIAAIKDQGSAQSGPSRGRLQSMLIIAQVALSVLLLAGASLFTHTLRNLRTLDFGFRSDNLVTFSVDPGRWRPDATQLEVLQRRLLMELETLPGIRSVSIGGAGVLTGNGISMDVSVDGYSPAPGEEMRTWAILAGPRFFETMQIPVLRGREFTRSDEPNAAPGAAMSHATVAILGEAMARRFFGDSDPIGRYFTVEGENKVRVEIVGVARDTTYSPNLRKQTPLEFYVPYFGSGIRMPPTFYLRADRAAVTLTGDIRRILAHVEPRLKLRELRSMNEVIDRLLLRERIIAQLIGFFSGFALLLTCLGLYGLLAFRVTQSTREIGVRMALGATLGNVIALPIRQGLALVLCGGVLGLVAALLGTRFVAALLYGVKPTDPLTYATVSLVLLAAACLASWLPARRAASVDPMVALRYE